MYGTHKVTRTVCSNWQASKIKGSKPLPNLRKGRTNWKILCRNEDTAGIVSPLDGEVKTGAKFGSTSRFLLHNLHERKMNFFLERKYPWRLSSSTKFLPSRTSLSGAYITSWMIAFPRHRTIPCIPPKIYLPWRALQHPWAPEWLLTHNQSIAQN